MDKKTSAGDSVQWNRGIRLILLWARSVTVTLKNACEKCISI